MNLVTDTCRLHNDIMAKYTIFKNLRLVLVSFVYWGRSSALWYMVGGGDEDIDVNADDL